MTKPLFQGSKFIINLEVEKGFVWKASLWMYWICIVVWLLYVSTSNKSEFVRQAKMMATLFALYHCRPPPPATPPTPAEHIVRHFVLYVFSWHLNRCEGRATGDEFSVECFYKLRVLTSKKWNLRKILKGGVLFMTSEHVWVKNCRATFL